MTQNPALQRTPRDIPPRTARASCSHSQVRERCCKAPQDAERAGSYAGWMSADSTPPDEGARGPERQPLSNLGGPTVVAGEPELAATLAGAMKTDGETREVLTHGFHSYPARMHWYTAREVLQKLCPAGGTVLDPFCGSGTVLIEARVAGLGSVGGDLSPLATQLARIKSVYAPAPARERILESAAHVMEASLERVRARAPAHARVPPDVARLYGPHVLKELAGLREEITRVQPEGDQDTLWMVFSSLLTKFSNQRADSSSEEVERRIRKGLVSEFFLRKTRELCERWSRLEPECTGPPPKLLCSDARDLHRRLPGRTRIDMILCSPPYGGTYDYSEHHRLRFAWLGLPLSGMQRHEIGARRNAQGPESARRWHDELGETLESMRRCLHPGAMAVLLMGDGELDGRRIPADIQVEELAADTGFEPAAIASQSRPDRRGAADRKEHLMALRAR